MRHEDKRNFNTALACIRKLRHQVDYSNADEQESYGNDADINHALIITMIDRCGDDDLFAYNLYEYIKGFPSKLELPDNFDSAFDFLRK